MAARIYLPFLTFPLVALILSCAGCPSAESPATEAARAPIEPKVALRIESSPAPAAKPAAARADALVSATAKDSAAVVPAVATEPAPRAAEIAQPAAGPASGASQAQKFLAEVMKLVPAPDKLTKGKVTKVVDGDTVWLEDGTKVRLIGFNTPEKGTPHAAVAERALADLVLGREVGLEWDVERRDSYKRTLAYLYLDGAFVNGLMVRGGHGHCYKWEPNVKHSAPLLTLQRAARAEKLGVWSLPAPAPAASYVGGTRDHVFHRPDCATVRRYQTGQRRDFATRDAAYDDGRKPHSDCNP
jgi:endonuclease YncB( thermonuclease family)